MQRCVKFSATLQVGQIALIPPTLSPWRSKFTATLDSGGTYRHDQLCVGGIGEFASH
jgi:hypothetical protein